ncbi:CYTH domain-containing protein [Curtobacterium sp. SP.BCp]|uniref:CYTH domain-containing protein n=1 Tax=Curtobacterium sp. SP.BCp TaxID=3435230 RepID=UPI003F7317B0
MSDTHLEIERTYDLPEGGDLPDLIGVGGILQSDRQEPVELDATYWDTERYDLVAARVTVRRRTGGADAGWHIKRATSDTVRHEQHFPLTDDADTVPDEVLAALFTERRGRGLRPVVRITTTRTVTRLLDEDGDQIAELADDTVRAQRLDDDAPETPRTWREVEVETVGGVDEQLAHELFAALDGRFAAVGAGPAAVSSKLARGLAGAPAPRLQTGDKPEKGTAARALTKRLRKLRASLLEQQADLRDQSTAPTVDLRETASTALGIAAVLGSYRPAFAPTEEFDRAAEAADGLAVVTARAALAEYLVERLPRASTPAQDALVDAMTRERILAATRERRAHAIRDVVSFLHTEPFLELLDALDDAVERPEPTAWALRSPKHVAQDVSAIEKPRVRDLVRDAVADEDAEVAVIEREAAALAATELAWTATLRARMAMDVLGDDAFPHALWKRIGNAAEVLTERVRSLHALEQLRVNSGIAERGGEGTFGYGVLAGDRVRLAEQSYDEAVHTLNRV